VTELASWIEAGATTAAVVVALGLWQVDRGREKRAEARRKKEHLRRLVTGLRVEVQQAVAASERQQTVCEQTIAGIRETLQKGGKVIERAPLRPGSLSVTDGIIYRAIAAELGSLPARVIEQVVSFYTHVFEIGRLVDLGSTIAAFELVVSLAPRARMAGLLLVRLLNKYEESDFSPDVDFGVPADEMKTLAQKANYDLDEVLRERGIKLT
jgi:hypothetical protein